MRSLLSGMQARLRALRYGFLLVPGAFVVASIALAFGLVAVDRLAGPGGVGVGLARDPQAARTVLNVIAGSLITVAGVTFSITMVTLQLVSQQFTPRALRGFLADRITQVVAGAFVGVFVYSVLVLRTVDSGDGGREPFVPALAATAAIVLAIACLVLLLVFIDHMGRNIQVSSIASRIARSTLSSLERLFPEPYGEPAGHDADDLLRRWHVSDGCRTVHPPRPGYVQTVMLDDLPKRAGSAGARIEVCAAPGDFVTELQPLARYWPGDDPAGLDRALALAILVGSERDMKQDPGYGIRQLADIASRAISPGVNDPTTAWTCIHYLRAIMERLAARQFPDRVRRYGEAEVTVVVAEQRFEDYVEAAYAQIGRYANDPRVAGALLESLHAVAEQARAAGAADRVDVLRRAARRVAHAALAEDLAPEDRTWLQVLLNELGRPSAGSDLPTVDHDLGRAPRASSPR